MSVQGPSTAFPGTIARNWTKVEQLGLLPAPLWGAGTAGCAAMPAPILYLKIVGTEMERERQGSSIHQPTIHMTTMARVLPGRSWGPGASSGFAM